jgi:outer membrane protein
MGQTPQPLTLNDAINQALKTHPRINIASFNALAANEAVTQERSALYPSLSVSSTGVGSWPDGRIAAGALNNPVLISRVGMGAQASQLITDFGRTSSLVASSRLQARAERETVQATRAQIVLAVQRAYYNALRARAVRQVAEQTLQARQLVTDQVNAMAQAKLKSGLDVSFAEVNLAEAKILLTTSENDYRAALADLSATLGYDSPQPFDLVDVDLADGAATPTPDLIREAMGARADVIALRLQRDASRKFAEAEKALSRPIISAYAVFGGAPAHDDRMKGRYGAGGLNITLPVFNGHLFQARQAEAELRARAANEQVKDLENSVSRDVAVAALRMETAFQQLGLTRQLLEQARLSLDLAQERYRLGLSSFVEVGQAQLTLTNADIRMNSAKYDYLAQRALLDYERGRTP